MQNKDMQKVSSLSPLVRVQTEKQSILINGKIPFIFHKEKAHTEIK